MNIFIPNIKLEYDRHILCYITGIFELMGTALMIACMSNPMYVQAHFASLKDSWTVSGVLIALSGTLWICCGVLLTKNELINLKEKKISIKIKLNTVASAVTSSARSIFIGAFYIIFGTFIQVLPVVWPGLETFF